MNEVERYPNLARERVGNEGWLDTAARLEAQRGLTDAERAEIDAAWAEFMQMFAELGRLFLADDGGVMDDLERLGAAIARHVDQAPRSDPSYDRHECGPECAADIARLYEREPKHRALVVPPGMGGTYSVGGTLQTLEPGDVVESKD